MVVTSLFHSDLHLVTSHMLFCPFLFCLSLSFHLSLSICISLSVSPSDSPALPCIWISVGLWQTQPVNHATNTHTNTHTHTPDYTAVSHTLSLSLLYFCSQSDWVSDQREAIMLCYGDAVSGCPFQLVTYTWRERGKGNWGEYGDSERGKTHTAFPAHVVWVNCVCVCVCVLGAVCPRETLTASGWVRGTVPQWRQDSSELKLHHATLLLVLPQ